MRIRNTSRLAATLRIGLWNLVLFLVGVLVVELVFGNWFGNDDLKHLNILRNRSWQYTVNYPGVRADEKQVIYSRDRWGLRGNYGRPEDIDILTVGGSTTDQRFITDGCTWQDVLSENLKLDGREIRIANAGINGRTTFGHQYDLDLWFPGIKGLAPDYILLYLGINDMFFDQPNSRFDAAFLKAPTIKERIKRNSAVYYIYRTILGVHLAKERDLAYTSVDYENAEWTNIPRLSNYRERLVSRLDGYEKRLHHLLVKIKRLGATLGC